jgi:pSer/pThr/pTyr-binding forkhead associated (FHA) protein
MTNYRTVVPGMQRENAGTVIQRSGQYYPEYNHEGGKPIVGFLVSVSRTEEGEFWILRQGQNVIGSGSECDIVLSEASVSKEHAVLAIHRNQEDNDKLNVAIMDRASSNGIYINNKYIGFDPHQCKIFDKIKLGNYELLLLLFDTVEYGLRKAASFFPIDPIGKEEPWDSDKTRI